MRTYNLGFIACGARNRVYARNLGRQYGERINITAICDTNLGAAEEFKIEHELSGHGGGDSVITRSFIESLDDSDHVSDAKLKDALKSALLAFGCDEARDRGEVLPVTFIKDVEAIRD